MTAGTVVITGGILATVILLCIIAVLCYCRLQYYCCKREPGKIDEDEAEESVQLHMHCNSHLTSCHDTLQNNVELPPYLDDITQESCCLHCDSDTIKGSLDNSSEGTVGIGRTCCKAGLPYYIRIPTMEPMRNGGCRVPFSSPSSYRQTSDIQPGVSEIPGQPQFISGSLWPQVSLSRSISTDV
uniref:Si:dkey-193b15.8 n=1 Tax=Eptatretus burgeri TaxID=7764 RepID=A0A8C4RDV6_EPTBU